MMIVVFIYSANKFSLCLSVCLSVHNILHQPSFVGPVDVVCHRHMSTMPMR